MALNSGILCARLGNAFHNRHRDLSLLNLAYCISRTPQYTWARVPGSQPLSLFSLVGEWLRQSKVLIAPIIVM